VNLLTAINKFQSKSFMKISISSIKYRLLIITTLFVISCKEKYVPPFESPQTGYLVVEGNINSGGATSVHLSRTSQLTDNIRRLEKGARVQVEGSDNTQFPLQEKSDGLYIADSLNLNLNNKYRLHIFTANGTEYLSEFENVKITPPIDSITWKRENGDVQLYVNSHDDENKTRYYLWDYEETWEFHSPFLALIKYYLTTTPSGVERRIGYIDSLTFMYDESIRKCWKSDISTAILIGSTAKLVKDVVYLPIKHIENGSKRISVLYSIKVRQTALTKEAYQYLEKMKKNTEGSGSIFDPQPSELKGNIKCVNNPSEIVIGFVTASTTQEKRKYISRSEVPQWNYRPNCETIVIDNNRDSILKYQSWVPSDINEAFRDQIISFTAVSSINCVNCTVEGSNVQPVFWP
jgi:hypothetical protein